jgi:hypothetical protein
VAFRVLVAPVLFPPTGTTTTPWPSLAVTVDETYAVTDARVRVDPRSLALSALTSQDKVAVIGHWRLETGTMDPGLAQTEQVQLDVTRLVFWQPRQVAAPASP